MKPRRWAPACWSRFAGSPTWKRRATSFLGSCWWASRSCTKRSPGLICASWRNELPRVAIWDRCPRAETGEYLQHRLKVAGAGHDVFSPRARRLLHRISKGIPRIINVVADRALLGAYVCKEREVRRAGWFAWLRAKCTAAKAHRHAPS